MNGQLRLMFSGFVVVALCAATSLAQDAAGAPADPTTVGNAPNSAAPPPRPTPLVSAQPDPAIDTIVDSKPTTPAQVLDAAGVLFDLGRADLAKKYLQQVLAAKPDENALADAAAQVDTVTLLHVADSPALQPEGHQLADAVLAAAAHLARDPLRLQSEIDKLADPSPAVQRTALKRIIAAHEDAVPPIVAALADPSRAALRPLARLALLKIGEQAAPPLVATLQTSDDALKVQIIDVLRQMVSRSAVLYLVAPATAPTSSPQVQAAAGLALDDILGVKNPTLDHAAILLTEEIKREFAHDQPLRADAAGNVEIWRWDAAKSMPVRESLPIDQASAATAARLANDLIQLTPEDPLAQRLLLISTLEDAAHHAGLDHPLPQGEGSAFDRAAKLGATALDDALFYALRHDHMAAATALAQVLGSVGDHSLLEARDGKFAPLVLAVSQGDRRLRFAAAETIMKIRPATPFAGSSDLMNALTYFADSPGTKRALVAFPNSAVGDQLAAMLTGMGYEVDTATNGRQAFLKAISSGDYELILLSSHLDHPPVWVTIQLLRHNPVTARTPIGLLAEDGDGDIERMQALAAANGWAAAIERPVTPAGMQFHVDRLMRWVDGALVPAEIRAQQSQAAMNWLTQLNETAAKDFSVMPYEAALGRMLLRPTTNKLAAELLSGIGTQSAQEALVDLANTSGRPVPMRQTAAAAFSQAVRKFGILLTKPEIQNQYERYNESAAEEQPVQQLLALILDALELPTKK